MPAENMPHSVLDCKAIGVQLYDYVDAALPDAVTHAIEAHLVGCVACSADLAQIKRAESALLAAPEMIPAPGDLYGGFERKLAAKRANSRTWQWRMGAVMAAATAVTLIIVQVHGNGTRAGSEISLASKQNTGTDVRLSTALPLNPDRKPMLDEQPGLIARNPGSENVQVALGSRRGVSPHASRRGHRPGTRIIAMQLDARQPAPTQFSDGIAILGEQASLAKLSPTGQANAVDNLALSENPPGRNSLLSAAIMARKSEPEQLAANGTGFNIVVQDDVRGFTAEAHDVGLNDTSKQQASGPGNGVQIKVELDDSGHPANSSARAHNLSDGLQSQ